MEYYGLINNSYLALELAAKTAVLTWRQREQPLCERIQEAHTVDAELGKAWLTYWMLARTAPVTKRDDLYKYMTKAKKQLSHPNLTGQEAYSLVQKIANDGESIEGVRGRPLSLVSKLAFSCQPMLFAPYDKRARTALKKKGHETHGDYPAYMAAFNAELAKFKIALNESGISPKSNIFSAPVEMSQNLFDLRTFDKYLMLLGGFSRDAMEQLVNGNAPKQHAQIRK